MTRRQLYFAYGSNLDPRGMARRCPDSVVIGRSALLDWRLTFRGVADVEPANGYIVEGVLWDCSDECIDNLDYYEGVAGGFYRKETLPVETDCGTQLALVYVMNPDPVDNASMPSNGYLDTIIRGYETFGLPDECLTEALRHAESRCAGKGVRSWTHDGRKRLRPATRPDPRRSGSKKAQKRPPRPREDLGELSDSDAAAMGISPATLADLRLAQLEGS